MTTFEQEIKDATAYVDPGDPGYRTPAPLRDQCRARDGHGHTCSRYVIHDGEHAEHDADGRQVATWPRSILFRPGKPGYLAPAKRGFPWCENDQPSASEGRLTFICTREPGHDGDHCSHGQAMEERDCVLATWPQVNP